MHETAFNEIKRLMCAAPCLLSPDLQKPFLVHVDAPAFAIGCVLQQDLGKGLQPIAFESRKLQLSELKLTPYDRELLALVHAFLKWKHSLLGGKLRCTQSMNLQSTI